MMFGRSVLVVEDDNELRGVLGRGLREAGFSVDAVATGVELLERA
jgi:CheY-like chemotaxis protein